MFDYLLLIAKNLGRNKVRTALTALAVIVLTCIFTVVNTITTTVDSYVKNQGNKNKLIVAERWVLPSSLPERYVAEVVQIPGVQD